MKITKALKRIVAASAWGLLGAFLSGLGAFVWYVDSQPDLEIWHTVELSEEFSASSDVTTFAGYLDLERKLFAQLEKEVYGITGTLTPQRYNRYFRGSQSDSRLWPRDWNRTYELSVDAPRTAVLLLHGLSDSPYSLRHLANKLHASGAHVVGLRLPGHGTAPSGLVSVKWEDWAAAVRLAMVHLRERAGDAPLYLVGYSNGGALSVLYTLRAMADESLPRPQRLVLLSPEIGVTPAAAFAIWQERLGRWLGLDKLDWNSVLPEYDPYKYQSFAVNAGNQAYRITHEIGEQIQKADMDRFPAVLVATSAVDATVQVADLITVLMDHLTAGDSELVIFDVNRTTVIQNLLKHDPQAELAALLHERDRPFTLTVVTNRDDKTPDVIARSGSPGTADIVQTALGLAWPRDVVSLSHVALPFPPSDELYGSEAKEGPGIHIGQIVLRGEKGILQISSADMLRIRWNPFYAYIERRALAFLGVH